MRDGGQACLQEALAHFPLDSEELSKIFFLPAQKHTVRGCHAAWKRNEH